MDLSEAVSFGSPVVSRCCTVTQTRLATPNGHWKHRPSDLQEPRLQLQFLWSSIQNLNMDPYRFMWEKLLNEKLSAQFLHIFTGVSGVGIALWLALFFTGCSFWRRFACFVEPLGGKKTWKNTCTNAIAKLISQISNHWGHWCCYCEGLFVSHRTEWSKRSEDVAMFAKLHSASARFQKLRLWNWISDHIFFESVFLQLRPQVLRVSVQILRPKRCTGTTWPNVQAHRRNVWKLWEKLSGQETPNVKTKSSEERRILGM